MRHYVRNAVSLEIDTVFDSPVSGVSDSQGFYLASDDHRALGKAMLWARKNDLDSVSVFADPSVAPHLLRRFTLLPAQPMAVSVWTVDGTEVVSTEMSEQYVQDEVLDSHLAVAESCVSAGVYITCDSGRVALECLGLEVARVVETSEGTPDLEVGVGEADRELQQLVHSGRDRNVSLEQVIAVVREFRTIDSHHPLTRLARSRWFRSTLLDSPELLDLKDIRLVPLLRSEDSSFREVPVGLSGNSSSGSVIVVFGSGADMDFLPDAVDYRHHVDPSASLYLAVPEKDRNFLPSWAVNQDDSIGLLELQTPWK